jgi:hypothetical protein
MPGKDEKRGDFAYGENSTGNLTTLRKKSRYRVDFAGALRKIPPS